ncbi:MULTISPECIES: heterocyst differentiation related protein [Cyanophyceae]|uniref:heterocyst differentiation related protein n=1 Tax=Cyanophyceae TaxID=3028117 RepID=UPI001689A982|nr:heterocyst differentiation related protein [Trichocoleus sp. FACHB-69]MBD1934543.1 heterocyst differentiation related protein [Trichocoleus sp. FACHB-69]
MSDKSMAFLAGAAFAGIAAIVLLKTGGSAGQTNLSAYTAVPPPPLGQPSMTGQLPPPPPAANAIAPQDQTQSSSYCLRQQNDTERLRDQLEQQRNETEQMKLQLRNQQTLIEALTTQAKTNVLGGQVNSATLATAGQPNNQILSGVLWAFGGIVLTLFGGIVVAGIFVVFSQQQRHSRTVQVIHPIPTHPPSVTQRRRSEFLPPRLESRRDDPIDYDRY